MDRIIEVKVNGHHLTKDNNVAGVQHESNATSLRIEFDESWDGYSKKVTFWDALGNNPVSVTLTVDKMEDAAASTRVYIIPIAGEAMTQAGFCTFVIDGYMNWKRIRSISSELKVMPAPDSGEAVDPNDPTPTQAEQLQAQVEAIMDTIHEAAVSASEAGASAQAAAASEASVAENASIAAQAAKEAKLAAENAKEVAGGEFLVPADLKAHSDNVSNPHKVTAKQVGAVAKAGDTMTGKLKLSYNYPTVQFVDEVNGSTFSVSHKDHVTDFGVYNTTENTDNARYIRLRDSESQADLRWGAQFVSRVNGSSVAYNLYGEHNKPNAEECNGIGAIAKYYALSTNKSVDDLTDSFALIPINSTLNADLYNLCGGTFAYVLTLFYIEKSVTARRMQIAFSYNSVPQRMAIRNYGANGWEKWRAVSLDAPKITAGTTDLTEGVSALANGAIHLVYE